MSSARKVLRRIRRLVSARRPEPAPVYHYRAGDTVIEDFSEFSEIPLDVVADRIANFHRINAADWNNVTAASFSERAAKYYETSRNYIFGILSANPRPQAVIDKLNRFNPRIMEAIRNHPGQRFFEFGGGTGVFCEVMAGMGKDVHYLDVPGLVFDFAQWRLKKLGLKVTAIEAKPDIISIPGKYDIVYTDAVIEHLPHDLQVEATKAMGQAVDEGGLLIFLVDLSGPTPEDPMHHVVDIRELHNHLQAAGLICQAGRNTACSVWCRERI